MKNTMIILSLYLVVMEGKIMLLIHFKLLSQLMKLQQGLKQSPINLLPLQARNFLLAKEQTFC